MDKQLLILFLAVVTAAHSAFAQTPVSLPAYVPPKATAVATGRIVYEGGQPAAGVIVVADMQTSAWEKLAMPYFVSHSRTMRDKTGKATVQFYDGPPPPGSEEVRTILSLTAADGTYRLIGLTSAPYNIIAAPPGTNKFMFPMKPWDWVAVADEGVNAVADQTITAPEIVLIHGVLITGRVIEASNGRPLMGIIVDAHGLECPASGAATLSAITDAAGNYTLRVAPGAHALGLNGLMLGSEMHDAAMKIDNALWSLDNHFNVIVDNSAPIKKSSPVDRVTVNTLIGQTHTVVFKLRRGALQYRLDTAGNTAKP